MDFDMNELRRRKDEINMHSAQAKWNPPDETGCTITYLRVHPGTLGNGLSEGICFVYDCQKRKAKEHPKLRKGTKHYIRLVRRDGKLLRVDKYTDGEIDVSIGRYRHSVRMVVRKDDAGSFFEQRLLKDQAQWDLRTVNGTCGEECRIYHFHSVIKKEEIELLTCRAYKTRVCKLGYLADMHKALAALHDRLGVTACGFTNELHQHCAVQSYTVNFGKLLDRRLKHIVDTAKAFQKKMCRLVGITSRLGIIE